MKDATKLGGCAIIFIVILRLSIGWQFLYEGLWKCDSMQSSRPWTAAGYLKNAQGPFRDTFRDMTGDPNELNWLDHDHMEAKWDAWYKRFKAHHPDLTKKQKGDLEAMFNGKKEWRSKLSQLPKEVKFGPTLGQVVHYDAEKKNLVAGGKTYHTPYLVVENHTPDLVVEKMDVLEQMGQKSLKMHPNDAENTKLVKEYQAAIERFKDPKLFKGQKEYRSDLSKLPKDIEFDPTLSQVVYYDAKKKQIVAGAKTISTPHLNSKEMGGLERMGRKSLAMHKGDVENTKLVEEYQKAIKRFKDLSKRFSYKNQLSASLKGDPERAAIVNKDGRRIGKIDRYNEMLKNYEEDLSKSQQDFQQDHLAYQWNLIQKMRAELVGPIKAMEANMQIDADKLLTTKQLQRGPVLPEPSKMSSVNQATIWGLLILGVMLLTGFGTRIAALGGAVMLLSFYLVMPPWPGVPPAPGPEHSLFVNKNLIEMIALIGIAFMPTGQWFGIDRWLYGGVTALWSKPEPDAQPIVATPKKEKTEVAATTKEAAPKPDDKTYKLDKDKK